MPDVTLRRLPSAAIITAGAQPLCGDVNRGEDVAASEAVAKALEPVRMDDVHVKNGCSTVPMTARKEWTASMPP